jgi:hypothetical protein
MIWMHDTGTELSWNKVRLMVAGVACHLIISLESWKAIYGTLNGYHSHPSPDAGGAFVIIERT